MIDRRAHERIDALEKKLDKLIDNTEELITVIKGSKILSRIVLTFIPICAAFWALIVWAKGHL
jgi:hypothetical protein